MCCALQTPCPANLPRSPRGLLHAVPQRPPIPSLTPTSLHTTNVSSGPPHLPKRPPPQWASGSAHHIQLPCHLPAPARHGCLRQSKRSDQMNQTMPSPQQQAEGGQGEAVPRVSGVGRGAHVHVLWTSCIAGQGMMRGMAVKCPAPATHPQATTWLSGQRLRQRPQGCTASLQQVQRERKHGVVRHMLARMMMAHLLSAHLVEPDRNRMPASPRPHACFYTSLP